MTASLRIALVLVFAAGPLTGQQLELRFVDVGQGDAVIIRQGGKTALVDAGSSGEITLQLRGLGLDTIDLAVASHNHADHIGGMATVLTQFVVRYYLDNGVPHTTATYQRTIQAVAASGAQYLRPTARTIGLGSASLRVIPPPPGAGDQNNGSVGLLVEFGDFRTLLTGDSELPELEYWLRYDSVPRVQVVKVAHHGSWNGTSPAWVERTRPAVAVISVGARNAYGHPSAQAVSQWEAAGARVYRTDRDGSVVVFANRDGTFVVTTERAPATGTIALRGYPADAEPAARPAEGPAARACCRVCTRGRACGNTCISRSYRCRQPAGCACDARP
ncbi:MAG TPA: ComEC/Rec2 family competence protein [Gemmatimonadales bacterium]|nr:ComEC/Rec2 family competence protein [Gemmatimonadales bacterium]